MAFFNSAAFSILQKKCDKIYDVLIFMATLVEFSCVHVRGKICSVKTQNTRNNYEKLGKLASLDRLRTVKTRQSDDMMSATRPSTDLVIPLFVAMMRIGAISLSNARLRNEKHSMSSM